MAIPRKIRESVIQRDGLICSYCGTPVKLGKTRGKDGLVIEHMKKPRGETVNDLVVACRRCNSQKGNMSAIEWLSRIDDEISKVNALINLRVGISNAILRMERNNETGC